MKNRTVTDDQGERYAYRKLLLATGGSPRLLTVPGGDLDGICYFRTAADYRRLRPAVGPGTSVLVVGNGFIGSELAAAACIAGAKVTMIFPGRLLCANVFPEALARSIGSLYETKGVQILAEDTVTSIARTSEGYQVQTRHGRRLLADEIVVGIGIAPNVSLATSAGLKVNHPLAGVLVREG